MLRVVFDKFYIPRVVLGGMVLGYYERPWYLKWKFIVGMVLLVVVLLVVVWVLVFGYGECDSWDCFNENLRRCDRVRFVGGADMIFEYTIKGVSGDECEVEVELLMGELNNQDSIRLEHQKMTCMLPRKIVMIPESNIGNCHGLLKEGLQDLVIKKLHTYIVQNLGKINLELVSPVQD